MKNTALLDALANRRMFILYRAEPRDDGKLGKIPTDPVTGDNINSQDPAHWMLPHDVLMWANQWNLQRPAGVIFYGVGIVLHDGCGLFCLDLDAGVDPSTGGWFPHVVNFESRFPEAYRETSVSGSGRHVIGSYSGEIPTHGTNNEPYRMQFYITRRFIGLTGEGASGSPLADATAAAIRFVGEFFPEKVEADHGTEWTTAPVSSWRGPTDDSQLIERAMRSVSPKAVFGSGASFSDLWRADGDVLSKAFPPERAGQTYDASRADQALANHLAFWTGNDCERMQRIMWQSGLTRDKWHRPDYLPRTILGSCGTQHEWYSEPEASTGSPSAGASISDAPVATVTMEGEIVPAATGVPPPPVTTGKILKVGELPPVGEPCTIHMMKQVFEGYCYVQDIHAIQVLDGSTITKERFDSMYGGPLYMMTPDGQKPTKSAWDAFTLSEIWRFPRVETQYFKPGEATGYIRTREGRREINSYRPADVARVDGDPAPFLDLVKRMLPDGQDATILLCYMAACCQNLGRKFTWWPFVQGTKGNGKTTIGKVMEYCMSYRYTHWAKADQLGEKFNSFLFGKLLLIIDEMYNDDRREFEEILKTLVTAERIEVRPMYGEKSMKEMCFNGLLFSNHQNGVRIDLDERRYAALFCAQQSKADKTRDGLTKPYFIWLNNWLWKQSGAAIVYNYLMTYDIPDELNPAVGCIEAPVTTSTELAATASLGGIEQELIEAVKQEHDGFRNGWISSQAVDFMLARCGKDKAIPRNARKGLVMSLGYIPHPSLPPEGMLTVPMPDGSRPRLYVLKGHSWAVDYLTVDQVRQGYIDAQKRG